MEGECVFRCGKCKKWFFSEDEFGCRVKENENTLIKICKACKDKLEKERSEQ